MFNIIARHTLLQYCEQYQEARTALLEWYHELEKSDFKSFNDLKKVYGNASIVKDNRVVFNVMGNKYRLIVRIIFEYEAIQIKWFGTHAEYDQVDAGTIQYKRK